MVTLFGNFTRQRFPARCTIEVMRTNVDIDSHGTRLSALALRRRRRCDSGGHVVIAPPSAVERVARRTSGPVSVERFDIGHFEIYLGEPFEKSAAAQVQFLRSVAVQS